jgi:ligand-binding sensor domain-containing protein
MVMRPAPAAALILGALVAGAPAAAQQRAWQPGDRVLIGDLGDLRAVAVAPRHVYAAGPAGIVVYDLTRDRWAPPLPYTEGMPLGEQPTALAYDRLSDALWLGTAAGVLYTYTLGFDRWERLGAIAGGSIAFLAASPDAVYGAGADGWFRLPRGAFIAEPIPGTDVPPDVRAQAGAQTGARDDPWLAAARGTLGLDPRLRRWPLTDAAAGETPGEYWIATGGGGLVRYDSRSATAEWLPIGLPAGGVGAVSSNGQRVWFGGTGRGRGGVAAASTDLTRWWRFPAGEGAPGSHVVDVVVREGDVWFAAEDGLYRLDTRTLERDATTAHAWHRTTSADGLPDDRVTSIAATVDGAWVTTMRGLAFVDDAGAVTAVAPGQAHSMARAVLANDSLWVATEIGLLLLTDAAAAVRAGTQTTRLRASPGAEAQPALRGPVLDVAVADDAVHALTPDGLFRFESGVWQGPERAALARIGRPHRLASDGEGLWITGERGVAHLAAGQGVVIDYLVPADIPAGPVLDVRPAGEHIWIATPAGALRLRRR